MNNSRSEVALRKRAKLLSELFAVMYFPEGLPKIRIFKDNYLPYGLRQRPQTILLLKNIVENEVICPTQSIHINEHRDGEALDEIWQSEHEGLQVGALLYALYYLSKSGEHRYATINFAARTVAPRGGRIQTAHKGVLKIFDKYSTVAHYWAAFLVNLYPNNYWGVIQPERKSSLERIVEFVANIDLNIFFSHAEEFRNFAQSFSDPGAGIRSTFLKGDKKFHSTDIPFAQGVMDGTFCFVPDIWAENYPMASLKRIFDSEQERTQSAEEIRRMERTKPKK